MKLAWKIAVAVYEATFEVAFYFFAIALLVDGHEVGGGIMLALAFLSTATEKLADRVVRDELRAKSAEVERLEEALADAEDELDELYQAKEASA